MNEFTATLSVPGDHPSLPGHFPGAPIVPGVLLLDLILARIQIHLGNQARLAAIPNAKFHRPLKPNEPVAIAWRALDSDEAGTTRVRFQASANGAPIAEGVFLFSHSELRQS